MSESILMTGGNISSEISHFDWMGMKFLTVISSDYMGLICAECLPGNPHGIFNFLTKCIPDSSYDLKDLNLQFRKVRLSTKPFILQKIWFQWICCKYNMKKKSASNLKKKRGRLYFIFSIGISKFLNLVWNFHANLKKVD